MKNETHTQIRWGIHTLGIAIPRVPVTMSILGLMWVLFITAYIRSTSPSELYGLQGDTPWNGTRVFTSIVTVSSPVGLLLATLGFVVLSIPAERKLGSGRFFVTGLFLSLSSVFLALVIGHQLEKWSHWSWSGPLGRDIFLSPITWILGPAAVASAAMALVWRRRIRIITLVVPLTLVAFSGSLADIVALIAASSGVVIGEMQLGGRQYPSMRTFMREISVRESRILVATAVLSVAIGPLIVAYSSTAQGPFSAVSSRLWQPLIDVDEIQPLCFSPHEEHCQEVMQVLHTAGAGPWMANITPLLIMLVVCVGLSRGRRIAWWLALGVNSVWLPILATYTIDSASKNMPIPVLLMWLLGVLSPWVMVIGILLWNRRLFFVDTARTQIWKACSRIAVTVTLFASLWCIGVLIFPHSFAYLDLSGEGTVGLGIALVELPGRFLPPVIASLMEQKLLPLTDTAWFLYEWIGNAFWLCTVVFLWKLLSSHPQEDNGYDQEKAKNILQQGSGDHLSWMGMWQGNQYWFAERREESESPYSIPYRGYVAYRLVNSVAITVGEPVVAKGEDPIAVGKEFEDYAASMGWILAWYSVREDFAQQLTTHGFKKVHVAEESVMNTDNVEFRGKRFQNIRTARNRAAKEGIRTIWSTWEALDPYHQQGVLEISEQWVADKSLPEMGFTLGTLEELADGDTQLLLAVDSHDRVHGVTSWLPVYEEGVIAGYTLDFMRRDAEGFRPVIEFLLAEALLRAKEQGCEWISLSGAPLAPPMKGKADRSAVESALNLAGGMLEPLYGFRSLAASKYKFQPQYEGWFLCYQDEFTLPAIGLAISHCYLPQLRMKDGLAAMQQWVKLQHK